MNPNFLKLALPLFFICLINSVSGQYSFEKVHYIGSDALSMEGMPTSDGGYIYTGYAEISNPSRFDFHLVKTDSFGDTLWTSSAGVFNSHDYAYTVKETLDGGFAVAGYFTQKSTIIKFNANGDSLWAKSYTGGGYTAMEHLPDSGFVMVDRVYYTGPGMNYFERLTRMDAIGDTLWTNLVQDTLRNTQPMEVCLTTNGFAVVGECRLRVTGPSDPNIYMRTYNDLGDTLWTRRWDYSNGGADYGTDIEQNSDGGFIICGRVPGPWFDDLIVMRTNAVGDTLWTNVLDTGADDAANCVKPTSDGGFVMVGEGMYFNWGNWDIHLIKYDSLGTIEWIHGWGSTDGDYARDVKVCQDGGYLITGMTRSWNTFNQYDHYLIKTGPDGCIEPLLNSFADTTITYGDSVEICVGGNMLSNYTQTWSNGATSSCITVNPVSDTAYTTQITNQCGTIYYDTVNVFVLIPASFSLLTVDTCISYTVPSGDETYTSSGTYMDTIQNYLGGDSIMTINLTINYPNTGTDTQTACNSFSWIDGNTYTSNNNTAMHTLTNMSGCDSVVTLDLTIINVDASVTPSGYTLTANATGATYQWLECPAMTPIPGATSQSYTATANGDYAVVVTENGCSDTSACYNVTGIGVLENSFGYPLQLYPNPTQGAFSVAFPVIQDYIEIQLYALNGALLQQQTISNSSKAELFIGGAAGVYLVRISNLEKSALIRVVKE